MSESTNDVVPVVDVNIPRFNQGVIAVVTGLAFLIQTPWLVVAAALVLAASAVTGFRPLTWVYVRLVGPRVQPDGPTEFEPSAPPSFSQRLGVGFLGMASLALFLGTPALGWTITLLVTALAALAATARICVGCIFYEKVVAR